MTLTVSAAIDAARTCGETLRGAPHRLGSGSQSTVAFGGSGPGRLGELGRRLDSVWGQALEARAREAQAHGARADGLADSLDQAVAAYVRSDDAAQRRTPEVP